MKVGIDLGTTNSAVAFIDPREAPQAEFPAVRILPIPQYVAPGLIEPRRTLPSFLYLGEQEYVGAYARDQGVLVPTRLVHSAKSWLSNPEVDRTAKILPWDSPETGRILSPVEVSARYLAHLREAWERAHSLPLGEQDLVLTVPASFDEEARELTVEAAAQAGLQKLTLLEEPAAAFYAWIVNHLAESRRALRDGMTVLVVDVGGGTSDFTLIRVNREGERIEFTRTAVGRHLLLGGDNLDLTLAWLVEHKLGVPLSLRQRNAVRRQCTAAKERLLSEPNLEKVEITVVGAGRSLVGGARKTEILREEALELTLEGFLPFCRLWERPKQEKGSLFREAGLPYVSDPAVTRHLAAFLSDSAEHAPEGVDALLFNGGFFIPEVCRRRVAEVVERWYGRRPLVLENRDLDLAVAVGAAYYAYVRTTGSGLLVRGGLPRAYYLEVGGEGQRRRAVCLVPRGAEEGSTLEVELEGLQLVANRPVSFRLYSSLTRTADELGQIVQFAEQDLDGAFQRHAPLHAVIRFGGRQERLIPVKLGVRLTEVGTLEIWCQSTISDHRWRLGFELRKAAEQAEAPRRPAAVVSQEALERAGDLIREVFRQGGGALSPEQLPGRLEEALSLGRNSWPLSAIRHLADVLLELAEARRLAPAFEQRWLNLTGFCLRPGFGFPGDDWRIERARRVWTAGPAFPNQTQNQIEWWIFWGRLAGGLNRTQQIELYQRLAETLFPRGPKRVRVNPSLWREMWRTAAALELLPLQTKIQLGEALLEPTQELPAATRFWCLARLGARQLFSGPADQVLPPAVVGRWVTALLAEEGAAEALASMARRTGDAARDLNPALLEQVRRVLAARPDAERLLAVLEGEQELDARTLDRLFGEELPAGLLLGGEA
jgi:molecular chaperone DnaK (HSP70)